MGRPYYSYYLHYQIHILFCGLALAFFHQEDPLTLSLEGYTQRFIEISFIMVVTIKVKEPDPSVDPIVVSFPGGIPEGLQEGSDADPPKFLWRKISETSTRGRSLVGKDSTCLYQGKSDESNKRLTKLCVGVYHKKTGKLVVYPAAEQGTVFCLSQSIPSYVESISDIKLTAVQRRKALFEDFGSQKKRKVMKSQEANIVNVHSVIGAGSLMMTALKHGSMSESNRTAMEVTKSGEKFDAIESSYVEARNTLLPPFNQNAKDPHMVYQAQDISGDDAWGRLSRVADACMHKGKVIDAVTERGEWHEIVKTLLNGIPLDSPNAKYQIKTCMLLNALLSFHLNRRNFMRGSAEQVAKDLRISPEICDRFLDLFTSPLEAGGFGTSKHEKAKCLMFILILYVVAQGRSMKVGTIKPIAETCKVEVGQAVTSLREAGFTVQSDGMGAALKVPLTFPGPKKRGGRGP